MPSTSIAQQQAAGIALAAKRGDIPKSKLRGASRSMSKMSGGELEKFASTRHKGLPKKKSESVRVEAESLVDRLLGEDRDTDEDPDKPLERGHVEPTVLHGGRYGRGVQSKGKTAGKFAFPSNFRVGHAMR